MGDREPAGTERVALVHDFLLDLRGAERVFEVMCHLWPDADIFTAVHDPIGTEGRFEHRSIHTSFLQRLRPTSRTFRSLLPLYPLAMEALDFSDYDLVISSSSAWAHLAVVDEPALHVCYCHNPFRYAWNARAATLARTRPPLRAALRMVLSRWRQRDFIAAQRVDRYIANSDTTRRRIARYFGRESTVVYPPVQTRRFGPGPVKDYYLVVSELMPVKRIDVAVEAFNRLGRRLVVVGDGPDSRRLAALAGPNVTLEGRVSDARVAELLSGCRALVVTAAEEFGIAAVEAQAAGRPVIALAEGGVCETVVEGATGTFYEANDPDSLAERVNSFDPLSIDPAACMASAKRFDATRFARELRQVVAETQAAAASGSRRARPVLAVQNL